jgi:hypothetical protein
MPFKHTYQITQCQVIISNDPLHLMKFGEMCSIESLVTKHTIYAEVLGRIKSLKDINLKSMNHQV